VYCPAESVADLSSMDGTSLGRRNTGSSNNMARNVSTRSLGLTSAPGSSLSKLESIASTAVRAAVKVGVRADPAALPAAVRSKLPTQRSPCHCLMYPHMRSPCFCVPLVGNRSAALEMCLPWLNAHGPDSHLLLPYDTV